MSKLPAILLLVVIIGFYYVGYSHLYQVVTNLQPQEAEGLAQVSGLLYQYSTQIIGVGLIVIALSIFSIFTVMFLMKKYARGVLFWSVIVFTVLMFAASILLLVFAPIAGVFMLIPSVIFAFIIAFRRKRIRLAGIFLKMSAEALYREKEILLISLVFGVLAVFTAVADLGVIHYTWGFLGNGYVDYVILFAVFLISAWISYSFLYMAEAVVIQIIHDWYRNPGKDVADLRKGVIAALDRSGPILILSFVMAILVALRRTIRAEGERKGFNIFTLIGSIITSIAQGILEFVTYFTLPAIMIEKLGFKDGVKRSARLVWKHFIDVILAGSGVGFALLIFSLPVFLLFGASGFLLGVLLFPAYGFWAGIVIGIAFVVFGMVPVYVVMHFMYAIYKTILYEYALDEEQGFKGASMLPPEVKKEFGNLAGSGGKRRMREPKF